ncbi:MAG: type II toxin-antitoxin system YafQ family toxin [Verrucomicrobia bacterium]|nr:type II toxin-antitoxin system YafQ family toxin [Verrucomicrobiota bacterium]
MFTLFRTSQFKRDLKLAMKRGKDMELIKEIMTQLAKGVPLQAKYRDHKLSGNFKDHRECHIEPDWLLIYRITSSEIIFERTGSHSDLFKK